MKPGERVVFIAGATGGLGRATAESFAADGARLVLGGTNTERLTAVADELALPDEQWVAAVGDVSTAAGAQAAATVATDRFGRIDILIHLVGGFSGGTPLVDVDPDQARAMFDQHVWTTFPSRPGDRARDGRSGWGRVIAVSSGVAQTAPAKSGPYAAAKAARRRSCGRSRRMSRATASRSTSSSSGRSMKLASATAEPRRTRWTTPDEIVAAIRFLCSDDGAPVNGARLPLDGRA